MDYFSKIINVFSSTKNETVEAESQESSCPSQYSHSPAERGTIPHGQYMSQMQPQGNSMYAVSINGQSLLETAASHIQPTKHKGWNSMNDQRLEGAAPHAQTLMNHMHHHQNYKPTVSMNGMRLDDTAHHGWRMNEVPQGTPSNPQDSISTSGQRLEGTASHAWLMSQVSTGPPSNYQDSTNMNDQRLEGAAPHAQTLMNHVHHHQNFKVTGQRLDGTGPHGWHTNPGPQGIPSDPGKRLEGTASHVQYAVNQMNPQNAKLSVSTNSQKLEGTIPHPQGLSSMNGQKSENMLNDEEDILNSVPEGHLSEKDQSLSSMNDQKSENMLNDEEDILNSVPEGLLSEKDKEELRNLSLRTSKEFFIGKLFSDSKELKQALTEFGSKVGIGFSVRKEGSNRYVCSRAKSSHSKKGNGCHTKTGRRSTSLTTNCPFVIRTKKVNTKKSSTLEICFSMCMHNHKCGETNYIMSKKKSGKYTKDVADLSMSILGPYIRTGQQLGARFVRELIKPFVAKCVPIDAQFVCNVLAHPGYCNI